MIGSVLSIFETVIDRVVPDRNQREAAKEQLAQLDQQGDLQLLVGQLEVNKVEAAHKSLFVAGWRPAIGWVCGIALANNFLVLPWANLVLTLLEVQVQVPRLDVGEIMPVLLGMLGLGGMRSFEKMRGVSRER